MKKRLGMLVLISVLGNASAVLADAGATDGLAQAESVVLAYLGALVQGDTAAIRPLLGGNFLRKKANMLNNPEYSAWLVERYAGASFGIDRVEPTTNGKIRVDVHLDMGLGSKLNSRLILDRVDDPANGQGRYLITKEIN